MDKVAARYWRILLCLTLHARCSPPAVLSYLALNNALVPTMYLEQFAVSGTRVSYLRIRSYGATACFFVALLFNNLANHDQTTLSEPILSTAVLLLLETSIIDALGFRSLFSWFGCFRFKRCFDNRWARIRPSV